MCHWLTGGWVHCQLTHTKLHSQSNSTDTEIVQDELNYPQKYTLQTEFAIFSMGVVGGKVVASKFLKVCQTRMP